MNDHTLAAEYINAGYNHKTILSDVSVTIPKNKNQRHSWRKRLRKVNIAENLCKTAGTAERAR